MLDDTQALGVLGERSDAAAPFGHGGGASLRWRSVTSSDVIVGASLAKGFGVPVAVVCGSDPVIGRFEEQSETRVHSSPASLATLHAAEHALAMNRRYGDRRRHHLWQLVERFCAKLQRIGLRAQGGLFPVQSLNPVDGVPAELLHSRLLRRGIRTVLVRCCRGLRARLAFLITASHQPAEIDRVIDALEYAIACGRAAKLTARESMIRAFQNSTATMSSAPRWASSAKRNSMKRSSAKPRAKGRSCATIAAGRRLGRSREAAGFCRGHFRRGMSRAKGHTDRRRRLVPGRARTRVPALHGFASLRDFAIVPMAREVDRCVTLIPGAAMVE